MSEILDSQTMKALSADARQEIVKLLAKRPHTASELAKATGKHVTTVTEHLITLEKVGLVKKKDSTNKWVYYTLTDKGEHFFKPQFYSWVVVFSLSVVLMFVGFLRMFRLEAGIGASQDATPMLAATAARAPTALSLPVAPPDYLAIGLIILGVAGILYIAYRKYIISLNKNRLYK